jgi:hypothetical protein
MGTALTVIRFADMGANDKGYLYPIYYCGGDYDTTTLVIIQMSLNADEAAVANAAAATGDSMAGGFTGLGYAAVGPSAGHVSGRKRTNQSEAAASEPRNSSPATPAPYPSPHDIGTCQSIQPCRHQSIQPSVINPSSHAVRMKCGDVACNFCIEMR